MNQESLENAIAAALREAHVRDTTGDEDDTAARGTAGAVGRHGSLRDALAAVMAAWPQDSGLPSMRDVEVAQVKPIALSDAIDDGWASTRPMLLQPGQGEEGQTGVYETKPWMLESGSDAYPTATATGTANAGADLAKALMSAAADAGVAGRSALLGALSGAISTVGGSAVLEGSVQQLVQAMAGFSPQGAGQVTPGASLPDLMVSLIAPSQI
ncbi:hypothetical protein Acav_2046 [Paracidovorax avenae ATCC 19860]|uniref:Uncharacterized protein n=1 Tax=Paracidovorax avenae (strain ATCC 19860 / DSM 7227 / CCUG 15838 / JCM 20985 / LMG 2117 / NCPPB 1011) TaxID=643561 RepID=F0Q9P4_PARA1|nr:hypothetical protein [Paracidovorax avenae]ADX45959.1 hypothetical protein Acav_2046 [Paracidovorax avenae ATCC 19860]AVS67781.1 hypothetical protein C8245_20785 [Paracidovorax avenae]